MPWYYMDGEKQVGPVSDEEFQKLQGEGRITASTYVWQAGMAEWQALGALGGSTTVATADTVTCAMCGQSFPPSQVIQYGESSVCAACKPLFFQRVKEGGATIGLIYAGFWIRFLAYFIDNLILGLVSVVFSVISGAAMAAGAVTAPGAAIGLQAFSSLLQIAIGATYYTYFTGKHAATPGKMACGIKVVMADGGPVSYGRACGRYFAAMLSGLILGIGYIMAGFDKEKRALHDHICRTRVVRK